jgi:hypothetical protein
MLTLGVERIGGDYRADQVQPLQQRLEPGDFVGGDVFLSSR